MSGTPALALLVLGVAVPACFAALASTAWRVGARLLEALGITDAEA